MNPEELKRELKNIFGEQVLFNREFNDCADTIKNLDNTLIEWCIRLKNHEIKPIPAPKLTDGIVFIKKLGSANRCNVIKIVNGEFREIHLADHAYYDRLRKKLGLKKDSI